MAENVEHHGVKRAAEPADAEGDELRPKKQRTVRVPWREVYYVGTEWFTLVPQEDPATPPTRLPGYFTLLEAGADGQPPREWDFGGAAGRITEAQQAGARAYVWGQTEGVLDPDTCLVTLMPTLGVWITAGAAPESFCVSIRDRPDRLVPLADLGCQWQPLPEDPTILILTSRLLKPEARGEIEALTDEQLAEYQFANLYIEPEKRTPDKRVQELEEDDEYNEVTVPFCPNQGEIRLMLSADLRKPVEEVARRECEQNDLDVEKHLAPIVECLKDVVEGRLREKTAEIQRRNALTDADKATWRSSKLLKLYPENLPTGGSTSKFLNRHFGQAEAVFPEKKVQANSFFAAWPAPAQ